MTDGFALGFGWLLFGAMLLVLAVRVLGTRR
jgi:hypothetical protein